MPKLLWGPESHPTGDIERHLSPVCLGVQSREGVCGREGCLSCSVGLNLLTLVSMKSHFTAVSVGATLEDGGSHWWLVTGGGVTGGRS